MLLPDLAPINNKTKPKTIVFTGLNKSALISDSELSSCQNLSFKNKPILSCRSPRETILTLVAPKSLFSVNLKLVTVDGTDFKYDGVTKGTVIAGVKSMVDFNGKIVIMPDKKSYDYTSGAFATIGSGTYPAAGSCPDMDFIAVHDNRVFGVKGNNIYASKLGDVTNWTTFTTTSTDAFATDVESESGNFTGIASYQNHIVIFKSDLMYELYNSKPPFSVQRISKVGCVSNLATAEINLIFYFVGRLGVYAYSGGAPRLISDNLNEIYTDAVLGSDGKVLYVSLYNGSSWNLYIYDTASQKWLKEDNTHAIGFTKIGNYLYCLNNSGSLQKYNSGTELAIPYSFETKNFTLESFNKKGVSKIHVRVELEAGSQMQIHTKTDNGSYALAKSFSATGLQSFSAILKIEMCDHFIIKFTGLGQFKLFAFQKDIILSESET